MRRNKGLSFYEKKNIISSHMLKEVFGMIFGTFAAVLLAAVLVFSVGMKTNVVGVSMEPALYNGQEILINRFIYKLTSPKAGDVIVFLPGGNQNAHLYVKRVVAVPGETVQIVDGRLFVNGVPEENDTYDKIEDPGIAENKIKLGSDEYFILGDNRNISEDSRSGNIGPIKADIISGKAWFHLRGENEGIGFIK